uniref:Uncharacterized protein n=1 Tax=Romanomermis culicivorax TaxID=13658 RepID=A0A915L766_ROMCU
MYVQLRRRLRRAIPCHRQCNFCNEDTMTNSSHSAVIRNFFTILTIDKARSICNYYTKEVGRGGEKRYGFGHSGLERYLASHPPTNAKYLAEHKAAEKIKIKVKTAKNTNNVDQTNLECALGKSSATLALNDGLEEQTLDEPTRRCIITWKDSSKRLALLANKEPRSPGTAANNSRKRFRPTLTSYRVTKKRSYIVTINARSIKLGLSSKNKQEDRSS